MSDKPHNCSNEKCDPVTSAYHAMDDLHDRIHAAHMRLNELYDQEFEGMEETEFDYHAHNMQIVVEASRLAGLRALVTDRLSKIDVAEASVSGTAH